MIQIVSYIFVIVSFLSIVQFSSSTINHNVSQCLSDLITQELTNSYNYLQLSSKFGTTNAYPGFSSLFLKLSDNHSSKSHDLVKFLALRKGKLNRLIRPQGVRIRNEISRIIDIHSGLIEARQQNSDAWENVLRCHEEAGKVFDANVQDYLESHILEHHIEIDKLLSDFDQRLQIASIAEKEWLSFILDEELLNTYGDGRKDIFSQIKISIK